MGRPTSSSDITLGGIAIVVLVASLTSIIGDTDLQWIFVVLFIVVGLWTANALNRRRSGDPSQRRGGGRFRRDPGSDRTRR